MEHGRHSDGAVVPVSQTKWDADRKGLGAFRSSKAPGSKRTTRPPATVFAAPTSPQEVDPDRPITLQEDPSDILARLANEALDIDSSSPRQGFADAAGREQEEMDNSDATSSSASPWKGKRAEASSVTSPDYDGSEGRWQGVGEYPLERLLLAAQRSATQKLLRVIDGESQPAPNSDSDGELDGEETGGSVVMDGSLSGALEMATDSRPASRGAEGSGGGSRSLHGKAVAEEVRFNRAGAGQGRAGTGKSKKSAVGSAARRERSGSPASAPVAGTGSPRAASPAAKPQLSSPQADALSEEEDEDRQRHAAADGESASGAGTESAVGLDSDLLGPGDRSGWGSAAGSGAAGAGLGLAHPDIQLALMRIKAAEERLKARESALAQKEAAVAQVDARQRMVHQLRQQLDEKDRELKRREAAMTAREARFENELRSASANERARLGQLISEGESLVRKLKVELPEKEADIENKAQRLKDELAQREAEVEPSLRALSLRQSSFEDDMRIQTRVLEAKEAELVAAMITARDMLGTTSSRRRREAAAAHAGEGQPAVAVQPPTGGASASGPHLFSEQAEVRGVAGTDLPGMGAAEAAVTVEDLKGRSGSTDDAPQALLSGPDPDPVADPLAWLNRRIAHHSAALAASRRVMAEASVLRGLDHRSDAGARRAPMSLAGLGSPVASSQYGVVGAHGAAPLTARRPSTQLTSPALFSPGRMPSSMGAANLMAGPTSAYMRAGAQAFGSPLPSARRSAPSVPPVQYGPSSLTSPGYGPRAVTQHVAAPAYATASTYSSLYAAAQVPQQHVLGPPSVGNSGAAAALDHVPAGSAASMHSAQSTLAKAVGRPFVAAGDVDPLLDQSGLQSVVPSSEFLAVVGPAGAGEVSVAESGGFSAGSHALHSSPQQAAGDSVHPAPPRVSRGGSTLDGVHNLPSLSLADAIHRSSHGTIMSGRMLGASAPYAGAPKHSMRVTGASAFLDTVELQGPLPVEATLPLGAALPAQTVSSADSEGARGPSVPASLQSVFTVDTNIARAPVVVLPPTDPAGARVSSEMDSMIPDFVVSSAAKVEPRNSGVSASTGGAFLDLNKRLPPVVGGVVVVGSLSSSSSSGPMGGTSDGGTTMTSNPGLGGTMASSAGAAAFLLGSA